MENGTANVAVYIRALQHNAKKYIIILNKQILKATQTFPYSIPNG